MSQFWLLSDESGTAPMCCILLENAGLTGSAPHSLLHGAGVWLMAILYYVKKGLRNG